MSIRRYFIGYFFSLLLTLMSFGFVWYHTYTNHQTPTHTTLGVGLLLLALIQLIVQLIFFLHIGRESRTRDILALVFAITIVIFVVGGSLWIMANLQSNHALPFDGTPTPQSETND